jgi:formate-dependent nitrite reductase membrane component NrfD
VQQNRAPYGRRSEARVDAFGGGRLGLGSGEPYRGATYYGRPAVKPSHYRYLIVTYLFTGGIAGAAQIVAAVADLRGRRADRPLVRSARYLALAGALLSPALLIKDLGTSSRWYNMLRIFRPTSPMSIGSWTLAGFGALSGLAALGQVLDDALGSARGARLARLAGVPAAGLGALLATYTGTLIAATSTPLWAAAPRHLPALFGTSGMATATAALSLILEATGAPKASRQRLERLSVLVGAVDLALTLGLDRRWRAQGVAGVLDEPRYAAAYRGGMLGLGILVPLGLHTWHLIRGERAAWAATLASIAALAGGYVQRALVLLAGNESARRPQDYFRFTQPAPMSDSQSVTPGNGQGPRQEAADAARA